MRNQGIFPPEVGLLDLWQQYFKPLSDFYKMLK